MTASTPVRDLPAIAAYAAFYGLENQAAVNEWKFITEDERARHRAAADAAVAVASLHTAPPAALNPAVPPDALALAETYWAVHQTVAPGLRGGPLPLEKLGPKRVEATKAGVLAVVAEALPSVGILDDALRAACAERDKAYRERAQLVAFLAACYPSQISDAPDAPGWAIVYVGTPSGQMSWHVAPADQDLFDHAVADHRARWDGHTTEEKYERLAELTASIAGVRAAAAAVRPEGEDDGVSVDIGSPEDGDYDRCEPTL